MFLLFNGIKVRSVHLLILNASNNLLIFPVIGLSNLEYHLIYLRNKKILFKNYNLSLTFNIINFRF